MYVDVNHPTVNKQLETLLCIRITPKMAQNTIQIPSVCLPRVYYKFDEAYIDQVFNTVFHSTNSDSVVDTIDLLDRMDYKTGEPFHLVFVHFRDHVLSTPEAVNFVKKIEGDEEVKLQYRHPWFWKVRKNKTTRREDGPSNPYRGPKMVFDETEIAEMRKHQEAFVSSNKHESSSSS